MPINRLPRPSYVALLAALIALGAGGSAPNLGATTGAANASCVSFPETGKVVCDRFLAYWQANGGLAQQGLPLSDALVEVNPTDSRPYLTQYFERARFELHPENAPPHDMLLGLLGREQLQVKYGTSLPPGLADNPLGAECAAFPETGKQVCGAFLSYWRNNGGLAQQGLPLTDIFPETNPTDGRQYPTQYFERARFEYHAEHQGTPYAVLLGLLGSEQLQAKGPNGIPTGPASGAVLVVGAGGEATIGAAVAAAPAGATIRVRAGVYYEQVDVTKPLTLVAYGDGTPVVDGQCSRDAGFTVDNVPDVTIQGFEVRSLVGPGIGVGGQGADRIAVVGNDIHDYDCRMAEDNSTLAGVSFYYAGERQRVVGNTIRYRAAAPTRGAQNGVWFRSDDEYPSGGGHVVTDNTVVGGWDGIGGEGEDDAHGLWDGNATVLRNHVSECADDGISAEGNTSNSRFSDNTIVNCGIGIANASDSNFGDVWFERNTIVSSAVGFFGNQNCFKVGNGGSQVAHIIGTYCELSAGTGIGQTNRGLATIIALDNTWITAYYAYEFTGTPAAGSRFDRNCLQNRNEEGRFVKWANERYPDLASFRAATGQESNGRTGPCGP